MKLRVDSSRIRSASLAQSAAATVSLFVWSLLTSPAVAQTTYSVDVGAIKNLYVEPSGRMGIMLDVPYADAIAKGMCASSNGWAGVEPTADKSMKATMLMAKAKGSRVRVIISGCYDGWYRLSSLYVDE